MGSGACSAANQVVSGQFVEASFCEPDASPTPDTTITAGDVQRAFGRLDLPAGDLVIQPPDGTTLVNFDTNFYTLSTAPLTRTVTLLGQQVTIEATPAQYHWDFGDGDPLTTTDPGAAYPDLGVTHHYLRTGTYQVSLDTTYTGRFRVAGGPWQTIPGNVTIAGTAQELRAIEATPTLRGY